MICANQFSLLALTQFFVKDVKIESYTVRDPYMTYFTTWAFTSDPDFYLFISVLFTIFFIDETDNIINTEGINKCYYKTFKLIFMAFEP